MNLGRFALDCTLGHSVVLEKRDFGSCLLDPRVSFGFHSWSLENFCSCALGFRGHVGLAHFKFLSEVSAVAHCPEIPEGMSLVCSILI